MTLRADRTIPAASGGDFVLSFALPDSTEVNVPINTSYPIPPSSTKLGTIKHPYFTFSNSSLFSNVIFQWQVHPVTDGPNRYTLVALPQTPHAEDDASSPPEDGSSPPQPEANAKDPDIKAIYNHVGLTSSISKGYSEGFLLLPHGQSQKEEEWEDVLVASLLAVLQTVRSISPTQKEKKRVRIVEDESLKRDKKEEVKTKTKGKGGFFSRAFGMSK